MENKDKTINLFKYIKELYAQKYQVITDIEKQEWFKFVSDIPKDDENIVLNYKDSNLDDDENLLESTVLLQVRKPEFEKPPILPSLLEGWINDGWDRFNQSIKKIENKPIAKEDNNISLDIEYQIEHFDDEPNRIIAFDLFKEDRDVWVQRQVKIDITRKLFNILYLTYSDLDRDSETTELMIGQGVMLCDSVNCNKIKHPILLKKVAMEFDALNNIIRIVDTESPPEIYTMLLQGIDFINHTVVKTITEQLLQDFYHPFDRNDTPDFLKGFAHSLHSQSRYSEDPNDGCHTDDKLVIINKPVFFVRKRTSGVIKAIDGIIDELEETGKVSGPLLNLIGEHAPQIEEISKLLDGNETLSTISGEDKNILLSKEANREQLEIAKRIENHDAVLVQGPPGTGKTHTIANLMGHFLAQGKNILVTSHTKKALSVVKEKVAPELQNLCVSVLDDNSQDMERSIDGITEYLSSNSLSNLSDDVESLKYKRENIMNELNEIRKKIFSVKHKEFETIVFGGESFSPAQAAKFVFENSKELSNIISGKVVLGKPFPIPSSDLKLIYKTNEIITIEDEKELNLELPNPSELFDPCEFSLLVDDEMEAINEIDNLSKNHHSIKIDYKKFIVNYNDQLLCHEFDLKKLTNLKKYLLEFSFDISSLDPWCSYCILDGKKGIGFRSTWEYLIKKIEDTHRFASDNSLLFLGKSINGDFEKSREAIATFIEMKEHFNKFKNFTLLEINDLRPIDAITKDVSFCNDYCRRLLLGHLITGNIHKSETTISLLREMRDYLESGQKFTAFKLFKPKNWKRWMDIYHSITINGERIDSTEYCDILIAFCQIALNKIKAKQLWYDYIEKNSGKKFEELGENYEKNALDYVKKIRQWRSYYSLIHINDKRLNSVEDMDLLIATCNLDICRSKISKIWYDLIEKRGGISFSQFGEEPEQAAIRYVPIIKSYVNWYNDVCLDIQKRISEAKLHQEILQESPEHDFSLEGINRLIQVLYEDVPKFIDILLNTYGRLPRIITKFDRIELFLSIDNLYNSSVCQELVKAIRTRNKELYHDAYNNLSELYQKYYYSKERHRILQDIKEYAPDWADLINNRTDIHGENTVPNNIEDAWKWKQFAGIINEITAIPFEELQHQSVVLTNELTKITTRLAEKLSWHHLLGRVEKDLSQKQALQGWKLTVKKIGKGTGKTAPALRREAQKLMTKCQLAVPAWIMPINKALESLDPKTNRFDIVIIDEASQSDISALAIIYLAKKIIIVGDDEQVSPSSFGTDTEKISNLVNMYIKGIIPNAHLYDMKSSLYDIAKTTFPTLMLKEHFRCVSDIIGYSNRLSYDFKIKPLRDDSNVVLKPATISYRVKGGIRSSKAKVNIKEAEAIVAIMLACMEFEEYRGKTFGVITLLGEEQAKRIQELAIEKISPREYEKRRILCGTAPHFQGDERDVILLSLVDNNEGDTPLKLTGDGAGKSNKQRYNVAVSRAKDQLWVVHSLDITSDLKQGDMRRDLIEYAMNPNAFKEQIKTIEAKADSPFEVSVAKALVVNGYHIIQQWQVGSYRIDMVAMFGDHKVAIECDGELYHSGCEKIREDMERQAILERLGWRFIRIRGSEYYSNPKLTIKRVISELAEFGIEPEVNQTLIKDDNQLKNDVIVRAEQILTDWNKGGKNNTDYILEDRPEDSKDNKYTNNEPETTIKKERKTTAQKNIIIEQKVKQAKPITEKQVILEERALLQKLQKMNIKYIDNRDQSGIIWIVVSDNKDIRISDFLKEYSLRCSFEKRGAKATNNQAAWRIMLD